MRGREKEIKKSSQASRIRRRVFAGILEEPHCDKLVLKTVLPREALRTGGEK